MERNSLETLVGGLVLIITIAFAYFAYSTTVRTGTGYQVFADFDQVGGLKPGSEVRVSGIKIGSVASVDLDPKTYRAKAVLDIRNDVKIPVDSIADIATDGLLGGEIVRILPGANDDNVAPGGRIQFTQPPIDLVGMIGKYIFSTGNSGSNGGSKKSDAPAARSGGNASAADSHDPAPTAHD